MITFSHCVLLETDILNNFICLMYIYTQNNNFRNFQFVSIIILTLNSVRNSLWTTRRHATVKVMVIIVLVCVTSTRTARTSWDYRCFEADVILHCINVTHRPIYKQFPTPKCTCSVWVPTANKWRGKDCNKISKLN